MIHWSELTIEEKREQLKKIAKLLRTQELTDKSLQTKDGLKQIQTECTRPFLETIKERLKDKRENFDFKFYEPKNKAGSRAHFDCLKKDIDENSWIGVPVSFPTSEEHKIKKSLFWGYIKHVKKQKIEEDKKYFEEKGLNPEVIQEKYGDKRWYYYILILQGSRTATELENEKDPDTLVEKITNDLVDLYKKVRQEKRSEKTEDKHGNKLKPILNALDTKPFIILSGISGTGKTQIARIISAGLVKDNEEKLNKNDKND